MLMRAFILITSLCFLALSSVVSIASNGVVSLNSKPDYAFLFCVAVIGLLIATLASAMLWRLNRTMSVELEVRTKAQDSLRLANKRMHQLACTDELSGMGNRRSFYERAEAEIRLDQSQSLNFLFKQFHPGTCLQAVLSRGAI